MEIHDLKPIVEAMIFVSQEPLTEKSILEALGEAGVERDLVRETIASIERDWNDNPERGVALAQVAGGYQFRTKEGSAEWLRRLAIPKPMRLSAPALETLAIVAYRQPIMRSEIEKIRGVDSGGVLKTLLERRLLRIVGRSQEPGQPLLYGTTSEFLEIFNLNTLKELPTLKDIDELMRERREQLGGGQSARGDDEDLTEVLEDEEEEEETEIIRRRPLDEDEEEEKKDMEALSELETELKGLRRLERAVFPKPASQAEGGAAEDGGGGTGDAVDAKDDQAQGESRQTEEGPPPGVHAGPVDEAPGQDAPAEDDRTGQ